MMVWGLFIWGQNTVHLPPAICWACVHPQLARLWLDHEKYGSQISVESAELFCRRGLIYAGELRAATVTPPGLGTILRNTGWLQLESIKGDINCESLGLLWVPILCHLVQYYTQSDSWIIMVARGWPFLQRARRVMMVMVVDCVFGMSPFPPTITNCTECYTSQGGSLACTLCSVSLEMPHWRQQPEGFHFRLPQHETKWNCEGRHSEGRAKTAAVWAVFNKAKDRVSVVTVATNNNVELRS